MGRIIGIDYGAKRVGLSVSDPLGIIATGLDTLAPKAVLNYMQEYAKNETIDAFVIGMPKNMDNTLSEFAEDVKKFIVKLKRAFPGKPVHEVDERFTSKIASQSIAKMGLKKKQRQSKELIDKVSATLILQS